MSSASNSDTEFYKIIHTTHQQLSSVPQSLSASSSSSSSRMHHLILLVYIPWIPSLVLAKQYGFEVDIVHRDSSLSPYYNRSVTSSELVRKAVQRSLNRANYFDSRINSVSFNEKLASSSASSVIADGGDYMMEMSIGTPPMKFYGIADTGSDLIWIQCKPCENCYKQDAPIFNPVNSKTFKDLGCVSSFCTALPDHTCSINRTCGYYYAYGDGTYSQGTLSYDTFTLGSSNKNSLPFHRSVFGCGHKNLGYGFDALTGGIIGLGHGPISLVSQLGTGVERVFSYCLLPLNSKSSSRLRFGTQARLLELQKGGALKTPIIYNSSPTFYYLTLESVSIQEKKTGVQQGKGNIIIDSGTTLTILPSSMYQELEDMVAKSLGMKLVDDPSKTLKTCFQPTSQDINFPEMIFHFENADVRLPPENTFIQLDNLVCLAMIPNDRISILGNMAQVNYHVQYDLENKYVSFTPTDCAAPAA